MTTVFLVMATASSIYERKKPIPLRVFEDREQADGWLSSLIDYHLTLPEVPYLGASDDTWNEHRSKVEAWRGDHPAGIAASHYQCFGVYEVPSGL